MKWKKVIFIGIMIILLILSFQIGKFFGEVKYTVLLAHCYQQEFLSEDYDVLEVSPYMNQMFQNFYGREYEFSKYYIAKGTTTNELYESFNKGGFHYLETTDGIKVQCGIYK